MLCLFKWRKGKRRRDPRGYNQVQAPFTVKGEDGSFRFRRWDPMGPRSHNDKDFPEFNLANVSLALAEGWDPDTTWTEDELVIRPPTGGCVGPDYRDPWCHFNTAIHRALFSHQLDVAKCLLTHGADINQLNALGRTVLHEAIDVGINMFNENWTSVASWIVEHGADLDKRTEERTVLVEKHNKEETPSYMHHRPGGFLPLTFALALRSIPKVQKLAEAGANVDLPVGSDGIWKPLDFALLMRQLEIMEVLENAGASLSVDIMGADSEGSKGIDDENPAGLQEKARDLISFCLTSSGRRLPASEWEGVYRFVLLSDDFKRAWESRRNVDGPSRYQTPLDAFFRVLSGLAQTRNVFAVPESYCTLCRDCITKLGLLSSYETLTFSKPETRGPVSHASSLRELEQAVALNNCPFCSLILDALDANLQNNESRSKREPVIKSQSIHEYPVELYMETTFIEGHQLMISCGAKVSVLRVEHLEENLLHDLLEYQNDMEKGTRSPRALALGKTWLNRCKKNHPNCLRSQDISDPVLPSRVLDVMCGTEDNPAVRLVETHGTARSVYCALSYCWGTSSNITTVKDNLERHKNYIPTEHLPATIQDAIAAARGLGFRYLWVDSLCIVHDDPDDWNAEVAEMGDVYANASLTISPLLGEDCGESLFKPRVSRQPSPLPLPIASRHYRPVCRPVLAAFPPVKLDRYEKSASGFQGPIHSRGWALQEQILSTRILWFGPGYVMWQCMSLHAAEPAPGKLHYKPRGAQCRLQRIKEHIQRLDGDGTDAALPDMHQQQAITESTSTSEIDIIDIYQGWESLAAEYTTRNLTVNSDRIPAVLGLAKKMGPLLKCDFVAGIWRGDYFLRSLLWRVKEPMLLPPPPSSESPVSSPSHLRYPSWTWGSKNGAIDYELADHGRLSQVTWLASFISMDVSLKDKSQSSATGSITVKGPLGEMTAAEAKLLLGQPKPGETRPAIKFYPDTASQESRRLWFLDIVKVEHRGWLLDGPPSTTRLILEPIDGKKPPEVFRRVGIGSFICDAENVVIREATIV